MTDPKPIFSYLVSQVKERFPGLAYIHVVESSNENEVCAASKI